MPKQKREETHEEQSKRFVGAVQAMIDAGELSPTETQKRLEDLMKNASFHHATKQ